MRWIYVAHPEYEKCVTSQQRTSLITKIQVYFSSNKTLSNTRCSESKKSAALGLWPRRGAERGSGLASFVMQSYEMFGNDMLINALRLWKSC